MALMKKPNHAAQDAAEEEAVVVAINAIRMQRQIILKSNLIRTPCLKPQTLQKIHLIDLNKLIALILMINLIRINPLR